jgi:uncharacterized membrane protein YbhN (UPF0104 family)
LRSAARVFLAGQLGKYLPGSVWPVLLQSELAARYRLPRTHTAVASLLALAISLVTALLLGVAGTGHLLGRGVGAGAPAAGSGGGWTEYGLPALALLALAGLHPAILNRLLDLLVKVAGRLGLGLAAGPESAAGGADRITTRGIALALGWATLGWLLAGFQLWALLRGLGVPALGFQGWWLLTVAYCWSWSVGSLVVVAPAGAGAREVTLVLLLAGFADSGSVLTLALLSRALYTINDLALAALAVIRRPESTPGR